MERRRHVQGADGPRHDGATGHQNAFAAWAPAIADVLRETDALLVASGVDCLRHLPEDVQTSVIQVEWTWDLGDVARLQNQFDVMLAPCADTDFYRHKSDLRVLEGWAGGAVPVAGSVTYGDTVVHGENGYVADGAEDVYDALMALVGDKYLRRRLAKSGKDYVLRGRTIQKMAPRWRAALTNWENA